MCQFEVCTKFQSNKLWFWKETKDKNINKTKTLNGEIERDPHQQQLNRTVATATRYDEWLKTLSDKRINKSECISASTVAAPTAATAAVSDVSVCVVFFLMKYIFTVG